MRPPSTKLRAAGVDAFGVALDVTDDASVSAAAALIEERAGRLDVLVNNAGITGGMPQEPTRVSPEQIRTVVETNVIGVIRVTNAMLPLLRRSASPRIVNMSSTRRLPGPPDRHRDRTAAGPISAAYSPSKTFLNAVTVQYAKELRDTNILINLACPGYVATDLNGFRGVPHARSRGQQSRSSWRRCPTTDRPGAISRTPDRSPGDPPPADPASGSRDY